MSTAATTGSAKTDPLEVVPYVDLQRYLGRWYEIVTVPQRFQKGCVAVTADYSLLKNGDIRVVNTCRQGTLDGKIRSVRGRARVVDRTTGARLKVTFFWPFWGAYWIIALDAGYQWAVVGHPSRTYLWILSRSPRMDLTLYEELVRLVASKGYDPSALVRTLQPLGEMSTPKEEA